LTGFEQAPRYCLLAKSSISLFRFHEQAKDGLPRSARQGNKALPQGFLARYILLQLCLNNSGTA
jgi:hypothetical protein